MLMREFFGETRDSRYGKMIKDWWRGYCDLIDGFPVRLRKKYILGGLMFQPFHFVYNGASFKGDRNTSWRDGWEMREVILYAPVLRREILPHEIVFDIDAENKEKAIKRARWIQTTLETLGIEYNMGFSGGRGFHSQVIVEPSINLPEELPEGFTSKRFMQALFNIVVNVAGSECFDYGSSGLGGRHLIREFFSINEKTLCFKVPVSSPEFTRYEFPCKFDHDWWEGYKIWRPEDDHLNLIFEEIERLNREAKFRDSFTQALWQSKRRRDRTLGSRWRIERISRYLAALEKYGKLIGDPEITGRHENEWLARRHLCLLMLEEGWSDEQILQAFSKAENFKEKKTLDQIRSCKRRLRRRGD